MADNTERGLYDKYLVERLDGKPVGRCIVLEVRDPNAHPALITWTETMRAAGYNALADDMEAMMAREGIT